MFLIKKLVSLHNALHESHIRLTVVKALQVLVTSDRTAIFEYFLRIVTKVDPASSGSRVEFVDDLPEVDSTLSGELSHKESHVLQREGAVVDLDVSGSEGRLSARLEPTEVVRVSGGIVTSLFESLVVVHSPETGGDGDGDALALLGERLKPVSDDLKIFG